MMGSREFMQGSTASIVPEEAVILDAAEYANGAVQQEAQQANRDTDAAHHKPAIPVSPAAVVVCKTVSEIVAVSSNHCRCSAATEGKPAHL